MGLEDCQGQQTDARRCLCKMAGAGASTRGLIDTQKMQISVKVKMKVK